MIEPVLIQQVRAFVKREGHAPEQDEVRGLVNFSEVGGIGRLIDAVTWVGERMDLQAQRRGAA